MSLPLRSLFRVSVVLRLAFQTGLGLFLLQARMEAVHAEQRTAAQLHCIAHAGGPQFRRWLKLGECRARQSQDSEANACNHFVAKRVHDFSFWFNSVSDACTTLWRTRRRAAMIAVTKSRFAFPEQHFIGRQFAWVEWLPDRSGIRFDPFVITITSRRPFCDVHHISPI